MNTCTKIGISFLNHLLLRVLHLILLHHLHPLHSNDRASLRMFLKGISDFRGPLKIKRRKRIERWTVYKAKEGVAMPEAYQLSHGTRRDENDRSTRDKKQQNVEKYRGCRFLISNGHLISSSFSFDDFRNVILLHINGSCVEYGRRTSRGAQPVLIRAQVGLG